jgi:hypothetical protein
VVNAFIIRALINPMMVAVSTSETPINFYKNAQYNIPEEYHL